MECAGMSQVAFLTSKQMELGTFIAAIDDQINQLLHEILSHPDFKALKSGWYGLAYLLDETATTSVVVRMLDISYNELLKDFECSMEFDQSHIFDKIYSQEFGSAGGTPFGVMLCDHQLHLPTQAALNTYIGYLHSLSQIAAAAFCPFILGANPELLDLDSFKNLSVRINTYNTYQQHKFVKWNEFRAHPDARFIAMALPRMMIDTPIHWQSKNGFMLNETLASRQTDDITWMSAVYPIGKVLAKCFESTGWLAEICGMRFHKAALHPHVSGLKSLVDDYPCLQTETLIHDELSLMLADIGFISLTSTTNSDQSIVYSAPSLHSPPTLEARVSNESAKYAAQLQYVLCVSRFSHYLKILMRNKVGSFTSAEECQSFLKGWLLNYTMSTSDASEHLLAKYPLREVDVKVFELAGQAGVFKCAVKLSPHYQLECVETEVFFSTDISKPI